MGTQNEGRIFVQAVFNGWTAAWSLALLEHDFCLRGMAVTFLLRPALLL